MRIVISSAGRRVYLVDWFKRALREAGISGEIIVFENNCDAATIASADSFWELPEYNDANYGSELLRLADKIRPALLVSLNDHELTRWSQGLAQKIRELGISTPILDEAVHRTINDKYEMYLMLREAGIETPETALLSDSLAASSLISKSDYLIVKDRFGSGSSGLKRLNRFQAEALIQQIQEEETNLDDLVIQPCEKSTEYGIDIVTPLDGGPLQALFARKKLSMRNGETAAAISVGSEQFTTIAHRIVDILNPKGLIDIDILVDEGKMSVIDINPRFGGGYPFSHLAGTDVPSFYVRTLAGLDLKPGWNEYVVGARSAKHEGIISFNNN